MSIENNTPEIAKDLPLRDYMRIFCHYTGSAIEVNWLGGWCKLKNCGTYDLDNPQVLTFIDAGASKSFPVRICRLLVKSLERISDQDAVDLAKIWYGQPENYWHTAEKGRDVALRWEIYADYDGGHTGPDHLRLSDFLRSRNYALPYAEWSVEELVEFGIYKLID